VPCSETAAPVLAGGAPEPEREPEPEGLFPPVAVAVAPVPVVVADAEVAGAEPYSCAEEYVWQLEDFGTMGV
jgi:hypothetical protein